MHRESDRKIGRLAARQHGAFSREQAFAAGLSSRQIERRLTAGRWLRLHSGVYAVAGAPATWHRALIAACLASGPESFASHRAAAQLLGLSGHDRHAIVEVSSPKRLTRRPFVVHHCGAVHPGEVTRMLGIPVTSVARTLADLASVDTAERLAAALDDALVRRRVTPAALLRQVERTAGKGRRGATLIRRLVASRTNDPGSIAESPLETRFAALLDRFGLPRPVAQHSVRVAGRRMILDFAYPDLKIAVECEGYTIHGGRGAWERDLARRNLLTRAGWRIVHVTWWDIEHRAAELVATLRTLLDAS